MALSIIMPCHNSASTIREAIESVMGQTSCDWELIIVDDGSDDNTLQLAEEYAQKDNRIRVLALKENAGVAAARNSGIETAGGDYVGFLDSDDTLSEHFVERMLGAAQEYDCDVVWCQYNEIKLGSSHTKLIENHLPKDKTLDNKTILKTFFNSTPGVGSLWNKIYSKNYIERGSPVRLNTARRRAEDWEFNLTILQKPGTFVAISDALYNYHTGGNFSAMKKINDKDFLLMLRSIDLLKECNLNFQLGFSDREINKGNSLAIFEHLYHSSGQDSYRPFLDKLHQPEFREFLSLTDLHALPISYRLHAILIKIKLPRIAYSSARLFSKFR